MPYISRSGKELTVDCKCRPPEMPREVEVKLFQTEIADGDSITVVNASSLPTECWANIGTFAALARVWTDSGAVEFTCLGPPRILVLVFQTLDLNFKTTDGATALEGPS
jgi:hypothetical protein